MSLTPALDSDVNIDNGGEGNSTNHLAGFFLLIFILLFSPSVMLCYLCFCRRNQRTLSDVVAERLRRQEQIAQALATANPDELRIKVIQRLFPPPPPKSMSSITNKQSLLLLSSSSPSPKVNNDGIDINNKESTKSSATDDDTAHNNNNNDNNNNDTASDASCLLLVQYYDEETNLYKWKTMNEITTSENDLSCSICLEQFQNGEQVLLSKCSHGFHLSCIMGWITVKDECPYCRQEMWNKKVYETIKEDILVEDNNNNNTNNTAAAAVVVEEVVVGTSEVAAPLEEDDNNNNAASENENNNPER